MKDLDIFGNIDDMSVDMIASSYPVLTDEEKERMFSMSERKFNINERKNPGINRVNEEDRADVMGVEEYEERPMVMRMLTTAAALLLIGGGLAVGHNLLKRAPGPDSDTPPNIATAVLTGTQTTDAEFTETATTYTIDVDAMLTTLETTAAVTESTTIAQVTEAQTSAAPPTEVPTETTAPAVEDTEYQSVARALTEQETKLWEVTSDMIGKYYDYSDSFVAYWDPAGGNDPLEYEYVVFDHPSFKCVDDFWTVVRETYTNDYGTWRYNNTFKSSYIEPGEIVPYDDFATFTEYNGKLYTNASDPPGNPMATEHYEFYDEKVLISNVTDTSFHAVLPVHGIRNNGSEYVYMNDIYVVKENGKWVVDGFGYPYDDELTGLTYETYLQLANN